MDILNGNFDYLENAITELACGGSIQSVKINCQTPYSKDCPLAVVKITPAEQAKRKRPTELRIYKARVQIWEALLENREATKGFCFPDGSYAEPNFERYAETSEET